MTRHCATGRCRRLARYVVTAHGEDKYGTWSLEVQCCPTCLPRVTKSAQRIGNERVEPITSVPIEETPTPIPLF